MQLLPAGFVSICCLCVERVGGSWDFLLTASYNMFIWNDFGNLENFAFLLHIANVKKTQELCWPRKVLFTFACSKQYICLSIFGKPKVATKTFSLNGV